MCLMFELNKGLLTVQFSPQVPMSTWLHSYPVFHTIATRETQSGSVLLYAMTRTVFCNHFRKAVKICPQWSIRNHMPFLKRMAHSGALRRLLQAPPCEIQTRPLPLLTLRSNLVCYSEVSRCFAVLRFREGSFYRSNCRTWLGFQ